MNQIKPEEAAVVELFKKYAARKGVLHAQGFQDFLSKKGLEVRVDYGDPDSDDLVRLDDEDEESGTWVVNFMAAADLSGLEILEDGYDRFYNEG